MSNTYTAALIQNGRKLSTQRFKAIDDQAAYIEATGDLDPMTGFWVDIRRVNTDAPTDLQAVIDNATEKHGQQESFEESPTDRPAGW